MWIGASCMLLIKNSHLLCVLYSKGYYIMCVVVFERINKQISKQIDLKPEKMWVRAHKQRTNHLLVAKTIKNLELQKVKFLFPD